MNVKDILMNDGHICRHANNRKCRSCGMKQAVKIARNPGVGYIGHGLKAKHLPEYQVPEIVDF